MVQAHNAVSQLNCEHATASMTITKLTCHSDVQYDTMVQKFRLEVPQLDVARMRAARNADDIMQAVEAVKSPSGFVLFAEYNHAGWMRHFATQGTTFLRAYRFTFGNPMYALPVLQHDIAAATNIPLDCCFIEELHPTRTRMDVALPATFLGPGGSHEGNQALHEVEAKLLALIDRLMQQA